MAHRPDPTAAVRALGAIALVDPPPWLWRLTQGCVVAMLYLTHGVLRWRRRAA